MIRLEKVTSILRFYEQDSDDDFVPYSAVCTIVWETANVVWMQGFHGAISRKQLRELLVFCVSHHIHVIKAHRAPGHKIPFMVNVGDHSELNVNEVVATLAARKTS